MQHLSVLTAHGDAVACARERRHNPWRAEEGYNFIVLLIVILIVLLIVTTDCLTEMSACTKT